MPSLQHAVRALMPGDQAHLCLLLAPHMAADQTVGWEKRSQSQRAAHLKKSHYAPMVCKY